MFSELARLLVVSVTLPLLAFTPAIAGQLETLKVFTSSDGSAYPFSGVAFIGNLLFGTTAGGSANAPGGTIYKIDLATGLESTLYAFKSNASDGSDPSQLAVSGGTLIGTTLRGYIGDKGSIFSFDPATNRERVLRGFDATTGTSPDQLRDALVGQKSVFYGVTAADGPGKFGTIFKINKSGGLTTLLSFAGGQQGCSPQSGLIYRAQVLFGTTSSCGTNNFGTVFSFDLRTGKIATLYAFDKQSTPNKLLYFRGGLYGTTLSGGAYSKGSVYKIDLKKAAYTLLYSFSNTGLNTPGGGLTPLKGLLYGTSEFGSEANGGVFSINPSTGVENVVVSGDTNNNEFIGELTVHDGSLYGVTADNIDEPGTIEGTVFRVTP